MRPESTKCRPGSLRGLEPGGLEGSRTPSSGSLSPQASALATSWPLLAHAPARAPRCAARTRRGRARPQPRGRGARRTRGSRDAGAAGAPPPVRATARSPRDASSSRAPPPARTSWKISQRPPRPSAGSGGRRARRDAASTSSSLRPRTARGRTPRARSSSRRRDEVVEEPRRDVALRRRQAPRSPARGGRRRPGPRRRAVERRGPQRRRAAARARRPTAAASRAAGTAPRSPGASVLAPAARAPPGRARSGRCPRRRARLDELVLDRDASPSSSPQRSSGLTIAARPAARSRRSRRRTLPNRFGISRPSADRARRACPPAARAGR